MAIGEREGNSERERDGKEVTGLLLLLLLLLLLCMQSQVR